MTWKKCLRCPREFRSVTAVLCPTCTTNYSRSLASPIYIRETPDMGRGVFVSRRFDKDHILEICPVLLIPGFEQPQWRGTPLEKYVFMFDGQAALALGFGSLYNHSSSPNARYEFRSAERQVVIIANRQIKKDEQVFIDYGYAR